MLHKLKHSILLTAKLDRPPSEHYSQLTMNSVSTLFLKSFVISFASSVIIGYLSYKLGNVKKSTVNKNKKSTLNKKQKEEGNGIQRTALVLCDSRSDPTNDRKIPISINEKLEKLRKNSRPSIIQKSDFGVGGS